MINCDGHHRETAFPVSLASARMPAPMNSPGAIFLLVISALALLVGLPRAGVEFGQRGLVSYGQLVLSPAAFVVFAYLWIAPWRDENRWRFLPSRNTAIVTGWAVGIITTLLMVAAAIFGVGSLLR